MTKAATSRNKNGTQQSCPAASLPHLKYFRKIKSKVHLCSGLLFKGKAAISTQSCKNYPFQHNLEAPYLLLCLNLSLSLSFLRSLCLYSLSLSLSLCLRASVRKKAKVGLQSIQIIQQNYTNTFLHCVYS